MTTKVSERSLEIFKLFAEDAGNWSGEPMIGGNFTFTKEDRGNLTQLKTAGLVTTFESDRCRFVQFTEAGKRFANEHGIKITE